MANFNVGDKVKCIEDCNGGVKPWSIWIIESIWSDNEWWNMDWCNVVFWLDKYSELMYFEELKHVSRSKSTRNTYTKTYTRSDWVVFMKNEINGVAVKDIKAFIERDKESIKKSEALLRAHRSLKF